MKTISMKRYRLMGCTALAVALCQPATCPAQGTADYRYDDATQLWRLTENAAGLAHDSIRDRGTIYFEAQHQQGDYRRVQEGGQRNAAQFFAERYQHIGHFLYGYGRFSFDMDRTKDRAWADVYRPYNATPYFPGSNIRGKYDQQSFDFTAAVGSIPLWGMTAGLRLDYKAGDLSRLRDPRSRSELLDYKLTPSLTYTSGPHTAGLSGHYNRRKEAMPTLTTVQGDPNLWYYQLTGMETGVGSIGGYSSFSREWVDHRLGATASYGYDNGRLKSLTTVAIERGSESIYETEKHEPGHYTHYTYEATTLNRLRTGRVLHQLDVALAWQQAYADEYRQQRLQTNDATTGLASYHWETLITYRKRYRVNLFDADLHYRANLTTQRQTTGYAGLRAALHRAENEHKLPQSSLRYSLLDLKAEGGKSIVHNRLWADVTVGYHLSADSELKLADPTTDYAREVLLPDMVYYESNYWQSHLQLTWQFPMSVKGKSSTWYVRAYGDYLKASHHLSRSVIGLSLGLYN